MRQLRWALRAEFPYTKVFILGILLTVLGSACVIISVVGIVKLAWGYYVSTGMWGGVTVTISGLAAMYAARAQTSQGARLYFFLSILTCVISFAMLVLSAGGLTYKSNFYQAVRFDSSQHQVTLFLHGSVLGVSVVSLACNLLSVIVCCKFITREKDSPEEGFKLRRRRHRFSDPNAVYRTSSLRGGSGTVRSSTSSRTPLFGSDRSRKHSRPASDSDFSTNPKIPGERVPHRRDSDRSRGSSRSRHSHHRQSSSISQQSRYSGPMETEVMTVLLRDTQASQPNSLSDRRERRSSHSASDNPRDSQADTITDNVSVQLVFDPDEEPPPPYEESRPAAAASSDRDEADTETVDGSSNVVVPCYLPLNIPVTQIGGAGECQTQSLQRQPPPTDASRSRHAPQSRVGYNDGNASVMSRTGSTPNSPDANNSDERDNRINLMWMTLTGGNRPVEVSHPHTPEDRSASPEICALTGARMTPVAAVQPDSTGAGNSTMLTSRVPQLNPSPDSSDTSTPGDAASASKNPATARYQSGTAHPLSSNSPSALPAGIRSPNSAFRPVGKRVVPLSQASPSHSVPMHNFFAPISSPASAHHTVYSPIASPSTAARFASSPTSPHHANNQASSSESLARGGSSQSLSWKKIPLPMSHNHSNRTSSVPTKEVTSKNIPGPAVPSPREEGKDQDTQSQSQSLPRTGSKHVERRSGVSNSKNPDNKVRTQIAAVSAETDSSHDTGSLFATLPVRHPPKVSLPSSDRQNAPRHSLDNHSAGGDSRSAFVGSQPVAAGSRSTVVGNHHSAIGVQPTAVSSHSNAVSSQQNAISSRFTAVNSQPSTIGSCFTAVSSHPAAIGSRSAAVGSKPSAVDNHSTAVGKYPAAVGIPSASSKNQVTQLDPSRRSAGCQATEEDGGIASSMDRTHRWVMGTLPSLLGTRFQGTTRNIAHVHSAAAAGTRPTLLVPTARRAGRAHGVWDRPSKTAVPASASLSVTSSQPVVPQPSRPVAVGRSSSPQRGSSSSRLPRYQPVRQPQPQPRDQPLLQPIQQPRPHRQHPQQHHVQLQQPVPVQQLAPQQQKQQPPAEQQQQLAQPQLQTAILRPQPAQRQLQTRQQLAEQQLQPVQQQLQQVQLQPPQSQQVQPALLRPQPAQRQLQRVQQQQQARQQPPAQQQPQPEQQQLQRQAAQQREEERQDQDQQQDKPLFSLLL